MSEKEFKPLNREECRVMSNLTATLVAPMLDRIVANREKSKPSYYDEGREIKAAIELCIKTALQITGECMRVRFMELGDDSGFGFPVIVATKAGLGKNGEVIEASSVANGG